MRMLRGLLACSVVAAVLATAPAHADTTRTNGDVTFSQAGSVIRLENSKVFREWQVSGSITRTMRTTALGRKPAPVFRPVRSQEFSIGLPGVVGARIGSSAFDMTGVDVTDDSRGGLAAAFRFDAVSDLLPGDAWIERRVALHPGSAVFDISMTLHNASPVPIVLSDYSLDEVTAPFDSAHVQAYAGGSDWRDDFRHLTTELSAVFDDEGEAVRFDDGAGAGWFFVTERRGGVASRVGSAASRTYAGVDFSRDLADLGPIKQSDANDYVPLGLPDTNHVDNPAYPVPARARRILPLSTFSMGRVATGIYDGGEPAAAAAYVDYLTRYRQPAFPHQVLLNSFHPWSHGANFNATTMEHQADVAASLGIDTIILDDQWQGGAGGESGDWQWDTDRFPGADPTTGKPADVKASFDSKGIKLGLWMSPAEFNGASTTFKAHPEWVCAPTGLATSQLPDDAGLGVWDFTNPALRAYLSSVIDRIVAQWGVRYFKFDFQSWVDCGAHDYNDYEDAFAAWVDGLNAAHPDVTFTFDETNDQRMYAFESVARGPSWFDNSHTHLLPDGTRVGKAAQILHDVWMAAPWVPPATLGVGTYDMDASQIDPSDLMPMAALTHMTFWTDLTKLSDAQRAETAWWLGWYHAHASELGALVYRLTPADPWDGASPAAFQPWDPATDSGYLFAFRQSGAAPAVSLQGLIPAHVYTLTNVRDGSLLGSFNGTTLATGIAVPLTATSSAAVYRVTPS